MGAGSGGRAIEFERNTWDEEREGREGRGPGVQVGAWADCWSLHEDNVREKEQL